MMSTNRVRALLAAAMLIPILGLGPSCGKAVPVETLTVSLNNTETFRYPTVGGDEEGARIAVQPGHASVSEIRRGEETNWIAVYVYRPQPAYIGPDRAQLEILTGSDGASPPDVRTVVIEFDVHEPR
jgi:hypothetical protein